MRRTLALAGLLALAAGAAPAQDAGLDTLAPMLGDLSRTLAPGGGDGGQLSGHLIQLIGLLTVLSIAPGLLIVMTCFTRFVIVLSMLRTAIGLNQSPPNMVVTSLALFLTFYVMQPVFNQSWVEGLAPLIEGSITEEQAVPLIAEPFHRFMAANTRESDIALFERFARDNAAAAPARVDAAGLQAMGGTSAATPDDAPAAAPRDPSQVAWSVLVPAFMISELKRAFTIGFLIYLPFVAIDLIVSSLLMGAGMMMLSPAAISLPFKMIFFVLIDGWYMLAGSLIQSYTGS